MRLHHVIAGAAFAFGVLLTACSGNGGSSTLPVQTPSILQVTVDIPSANAGASARRGMSIGSRAKSAYIYVYGGTAQTPPPSSLAGVIDLSASSKDCVPSGSGRTCQIKAKTSGIGVMVVHADFYDQSPSGSTPSGKKLGSTHTHATLSGNDAYGIVTDGAIAKLNMTLSEKWLGGASDFSASLDPVDSEGKHVVASGLVAVYAPSGAVTASAAPQASIPPIVSDGVVADTSNGEAHFHYTGAQFVNPMTVVGIVGTFAKTAQIWPSNPALNPPPAAYPAGTPMTFAQDPFVSSNDRMNTEQYKLKFSIGSTVSDVQVDTGSELFLVNPEEIAGAGAGELLGPGEAGFETLSSDGNFYAGHYYLARVKLHSDDGATVVGRTVPMMVLVNDVNCAKCLHDNLMGVAFGRPTSTPDPQYGPTYKLPVMNALLQQEKIVTGTDLVAGYRLSADKLQIGLAQSNTSDFTGANVQQLQRFDDRAGDWKTPLACISFGDAACQQATVLVDVGIKYMILQGFGADAASGKKIALHFLSGDGQNPANVASTLSFAPQYGDPSENPPKPSDWATPPAPAYVNLRKGSAPPFINTGLQPVHNMDYMYDNVYGRVGYMTNS